MFADRLLLLLLLSVRMIMLIVMMIVMMMMMLMLMWVIMVIVSIEGVFNIYMHLAGELGPLRESTTSAASGAGTVRRAGPIEAGAILVLGGVPIAETDAVQQRRPMRLEVGLGGAHTRCCSSSVGVGHGFHGLIASTTTWKYVTATA